MYPTVILNALTLEEGKDYLLTGDYSAEKAGTTVTSDFGNLTVLPQKVLNAMRGWDVTLDMTDEISAEKGVLLQNENGKLLLADSALISNNHITFKVKTGADSAIIYGTNGDTDNDGKAAFKDMMQILHHVSNRSALNEVQKGFADVDMSGAVNLQDLMRELHYVSGRSKTLYEVK